MADDDYEHDTDDSGYSDAEFDDPDASDDLDDLDDFGDDEDKDDEED